MKEFLSAVFLVLLSVANAQTTDIMGFIKSDLQKAEMLYDDRAYPNAIELYRRVLSKNPNEFRAKLRIAESFNKLKNPDSTVVWYEKVIHQNDLEPGHYYDFAQALSMTGNYQEARKWYRKFGEVTNDPRVERKITFIDNLDFHFRDSSLYFIDLLPINSENSDFGAVPFENGLVFLSAREDDLFIKYTDSEGNDEQTEARLDLYFTSVTDSGYSTPEKFNQSINTRFHEGPLAFFNNSQKVIFTRNNYYHHKKGRSKDGEVKLKMYTTVRKDDEWTDFKPFPYDDDEYSTAHPSVNKSDQLLFFSSDMPGGYGQSDLYVCRWVNGSWEKPVNLGPGVNTKGDEMFPFIAHDGNLYFASDGHGGFGGLDIYRAHLVSGFNYGRIENLGYPLNSNRDDFAFTLNEDDVSGYISSNREGGTGRDDIYRFNRRYLHVLGKVEDMNKGSLVPQAKVIILDSLRKKEIVRETDQNGYFTVDLPLESKFGLKAFKDGYFSKRQSVVSSSGKNFETDTVTVFMEKQTLFAEGRVFSNETQSILKGAKISLRNLETDSLQEQVIDSLYFFVLRTGEKYRVTAQMKDHISKEFTLNTSGLDDDTLRNDFVLEEMYRDKNIVFFDFDAAELDQKAKNKINEMVRIMKRYPKTHMVVSAHADAQGNFEYNKSLSDRRAMAVVNHMNSMGIPADRIAWRGFGEELLLNQCSDGVACEAEDHSLNRRAELKIEDDKPEDPFTTTTLTTEDVEER